MKGERYTSKMKIGTHFFLEIILKDKYSGISCVKWSIFFPLWPILGRYNCLRHFNDNFQTTFFFKPWKLSWRLLIYTGVPRSWEQFTSARRNILLLTFFGLAVM